MKLNDLIEFSSRLGQYKKLLDLRKYFEKSIVQSVTITVKLRSSTKSVTLNSFEDKNTMIQAIDTCISNIESDCKSKGIEVDLNYE